MTKTLSDLKAELDRAVADRDRITSRASSIPARRERAAEGLHEAKKAAARGGDASAVEEARAALTALSEEEALAPYEQDAAEERVLEAEIAHADQEYREATEAASAAFGRAISSREQKERFDREERQHTGEATGWEGQANRALQTARNAAVALEKRRSGRQTRKEQTLVDAGVGPKTRQRRRGEVTMDQLR